MSQDDFIRGHEAGLLQGQTVGESLERERIIKLLEDNFKTDNAYLVTVEDDKPAKLNELIALIKGDGK